MEVRTPVRFCFELHVSEVYILLSYSGTVNAIVIKNDYSPCGVDSAGGKSIY